MSEQRLSLTEIQYRRLFPWLLIFRCFKLAADPKKIVLALIGVIVFGVGWRVINTAFSITVFRPTESEAAQEAAAETAAYFVGPSALPWDSGGTAARIWRAYGDEEGRSPLRTLPGALQDPPGFLLRIATRWDVPLTPIRILIEPFRAMFTQSYPRSELGFDIPGLNARFDAGYVVYLVALGLWAAICWGIFGGAISRIAAMQLARDERVSLREAITYGLRYAPSTIAAPFIPLFGVGIFVFFCLVGGWISNIPGFGPWFAGVLWFLPLVAGLVMALLVVGWAVGWPLMVPTLAVEATDAFDAVSRAFAYSYQRPWNYLFYGSLTIVYGSIATFIFLVFVQLTLYLSVWAVSWGASNELLATLATPLPGYAYRLLMMPYEAGEPPASILQAMPAYVFTFWVMLMVLTAPAFVYSFFWSAATAVYLLLRRDVDATDIDEIWTPEEFEESFFEPSTFEPTPPAEQPAAAEPAASTATAEGSEGARGAQDQGEQQEREEQE